MGAAQTESQKGLDGRGAGAARARGRAREAAALAACRERRLYDKHVGAVPARQACESPFWSGFQPPFLLRIPQAALKFSYRSDSVARY